MCNQSGDKFISEDEESTQYFLGGLVIKSLSIRLVHFHLLLKIEDAIFLKIILFLKFDILSAHITCSCSTSNWRCAETLGDYLAKRNIMGICKS